MRKGTVTMAAAVVGAGLCASHADAQTRFLGPKVYLCVDNSPLMGMPGFVFDDIEDGMLNIPGVTNDVGAPIAPSGATDSVDCDDGMIDGLGRGGRTIFSPNGPAGITLMFDPGVLGGFPTAAGVVWTDGLQLTTFEAFDANGVSLGTVSASHADNSFSGETAEDRFYGVLHAGGISSIHIRNASGGIEIDHIQYAFPAPVCYADCEGDGDLDLFDFICFGDAFASMDEQADCECDEDFDLFDFICFGDAFAAGCP